MSQTYHSLEKLPVIKESFEDMRPTYKWRRLTKKISWFLHNKFSAFKQMKNTDLEVPAKPAWMPNSNWELLAYLSHQLPKSFPMLLYNVTTEITTWRRFSNEFNAWGNSDDAKFPSDWNRLLKIQKMLMWLIFKPELISRNYSFLLDENISEIEEGLIP